MSANGIVLKIWNFYHTLRDDGVGYGDYLEQITYLLFLKIAHEYSQRKMFRVQTALNGFQFHSYGTAMSSLIPSVMIQFGRR